MDWMSIVRVGGRGGFKKLRYQRWLCDKWWLLYFVVWIDNMKMYHNLNIVLVWFDKDGSTKYLWVYFAYYSYISGISWWLQSAMKKTPVWSVKISLLVSVSQVWWKIYIIKLSQKHKITVILWTMVLNNQLHSTGKYNNKICHCLMFNAM